jgi:MFS family permease
MRSPLGTDHDRVVLQYYLYRAASNPGFFYPIYVLFLVDVNGLSYTAVGLIGSVQAAIVLVGEVPTGFVGDRIGRRNSLVVASALFLVSTLSFLVVTDLPGFVFSFGTISIASTFISGSGQAWLYDMLDERLDTSEFTRVQGRGSAAAQWSMAVTMIAGGLLYVVNPLYPFAAGAVVHAVSLLLVLTLPKNRQYSDRASGEGDASDEDGESADEILTVFDALPLLRTKLSRPPLRSFVAFTALYAGAVMTADAYIQPVTLDAIRGSLAAALASVGLPEAATLGFLYSAFTVVSALAADRADDVESLLGTRGALLLVPVVIAVTFLLPAVVPVLAFPMFFVMKGGGAVFHPIAGQYLNDRLESVGRATVLSAVSMVEAVARIPYAVGSGVVADAFDVRVAVAVLGGTFLLGAAALDLFGPGVATDDTPTSTAD